MTTRAFQKIYTKIENITKATVTLRAEGVGNDELATVGGKLAQVVKIMGDQVTLQVFAGTEGITTDSEVIFHGEPPKLRVSDNLAGRFFNAYGEPIEGGEQIEGEAREIGGPTVNPFRLERRLPLLQAGVRKRRCARSHRFVRQYHGESPGGASARAGHGLDRRRIFRRR